MPDIASSTPSVPKSVLLAQAVRKGRMSKEQADFLAKSDADIKAILLFFTCELKESVVILP